MRNKKCKKLRLVFVLLPCLVCVLAVAVLLPGSGSRGAAGGAGGSDQLEAAGGAGGSDQLEAAGGAGESDQLEAAGGEGQPGSVGDVGQPESGVGSMEETEPEAATEITLVMVGDVLLHTRVAESGRKEDGGYDFSAVFAHVKEEIEAADLALVNQEVIIGGEELGVTGYPSFNAPYELGDALADTGFDVVLHATNHALDKGKRGILNCLAFWEENYPEMAVLGIHQSQARQEEIYIYEQEGIKVAVLNYTYGTNGIALPGDMPYAVDLLEKDRMSRDLQKAREEADFVIVCPHWGTEYSLEASKSQKDLAAWFAEKGADLVLGTHPHVIEPIEILDGEEEEGTLVYYSLGNFVNWTSGTGQGVANRMVGGMARITIGLNEAGRAVVKDYGVEPLICHVETGVGGVTVYPLEEYTEELASRNEICLQDGSFSLEYCRNLVEEVFGARVY